MLFAFLTANPLPGVALLLVVIALGIGFYFVPSIIAVAKKKTNPTAIVALNLLLGWTVLGWIVALVWALTVDKNPRRAEEIQPGTRLPPTGTQTA